jgi:hypothetical protein
MIIGCTHSLTVGAREIIDMIDPRTDNLRTNVPIWVLREATHDEWLRSIPGPRSHLTANMLEHLENIRYYDVNMDEAL